MFHFHSLTTLHSWLPTTSARRPKAARRAGRVRLELLPLEDRTVPALVASGAGTGLVADYYSDANLANLVRTRTDPGVNFDWGTGSPDAAVPADQFSVRWTGQVQAQYSETYTFSTVTAGGVRLWVNGQELIDDWADHAAKADSGTITLKAGESYSITLEYANNSGPATAELFWSSPSTPNAAVPATQLYPSGGWLDTGLGSAGGSAGSTGGTFAVQGGGSFGDTADGGHFVYQALTGDGVVTAQVTGGVPAGGSPGQAGLMVRDGLAADGREVALFVAADGVHFQSRTAPGAAATDAVKAGVTGPIWLKIVRDGSLISGYSSRTGADGTWTLVGTATVNLPTTADFGFAAAGTTATVSGAAVTATVPIGGNLQQLHDWALNNAFVDIFKQAREFYSVAKSANGPLVQASVDANGWATEDFIAFVQTGLVNTAHIYNGTYKLSFTGKADVDTWVTPGGSVQNLKYDPATNTTTADVILNASDSQGGWYFTLKFTNTSGAVRNVQLIRPGYDPANHPTFTSQFLATLAPFTTIRTMEFARTIDNPVVNWADRAHVADATQTSNRGVAWEYIAELANAAHKDVWINVPVGATDDYVRQLATLFKTLLDPDLAVYVEFSNEMWNGSYSETGANKDAAVAEVAAGIASGHPSNLMLPGETGKNADGTWTYQWEWAFRRQARRTKEISDIFASVWGADAINSRVRVVLASQIVNGYIPQTQLSWLNQTFGAPGKYLYALAGAPYFYVGAADQQTNLTADQVLSALSAGIDANAGFVQDYSRWAATYGLKLVAYEGGPDTFGPNNVAAKKAASLDPRMKDLTVKALDQWFGAGGGLINWYVAGPTDYDTQYGTWGVTDRIDDTGAPKLQAIQQVAAGPVAATAGAAAEGTVAAINYVGSTSTDPYPRYLHNGATLDYLVRSPADGPYTLTVNYAAVSAGGQLRIWVNGVAVQTLTPPATGPSYDSQWAPNSFADAPAVPLTLRAGVNDVRLEVVAEGYTLNALTFAGASQPGTPAPPVVVAPPAPPTVVAAAAAPGTVTGTTAALSVLGADPAGEAGLTYTWSVTGTPPAAVDFSANGTNAATATTATFHAAGTYAFQVTIRDAAGLTATSAVNVTVSPTPTTLTLSPSTGTLAAGGSLQFTPTGSDQFGNALPAVGTVAWSVTGTGAAGSVTPSGLYTASAAGGGTDTVTATVGGVSGSAAVTVAAAPTPVTGPVSSGISYVRGFGTTGLALNGYAAVRGGRLRLTNGGYQRGSAFFQSPVGVGRFTTAFNLQSNGGNGEGIAFVLQGVGPTALGSGGGGLGYAGIADSLAVKFDVNGDAGVGKNMVGLAVNGGTPVGPSLDLTKAGIDLRSGHELRVVVTYDAGALTVLVSDVATGRAAQLKAQLDLPSIVGGTAAYAGFTAATSGLAATQEVLNWTFTTVPDGQPLPRTVLARR